MANYLSPFSAHQFIDANGKPYTGALLFTYAVGSSTKVTTYKDEAGASPHANPIVLNTKGFPADGSGVAYPIWQIGGAAVKFVLAPSTDTDPPASPIETWNNIDGINDTSVTIDQWIAGSTPTYVSATSFTVTGDQSSTYHVGRRVKTTNSGGTIYSRISAVAYTTLTTVTVVNDSGTLDSGLSAVSYSLLSATGSSVPGVTVSGTTWTFPGSVSISGTVTSNHTFSTGDVKLTIKSSADTGWVIMDDGTIGNASSSATTRANADTETLFALIWDNISNTYCPIYTSAGAVSTRGASAAADYAANKRIRIPRTVGRAMAGTGSSGAFSSTFTADAGTDVCTVDSNLSLYTGAIVQVATTTTLPAGLSAATDYYVIRTAATTLQLATSLANAHAGTVINITDAGTGTHTMTMSLSVRTLGQHVGEESHSSTDGENGPHNHTGTYYTAGGGGGTGAQASVGTGGATGTAYVPSDGSGTAHNTMQPTTFFNVMIKL